MPSKPNLVLIHSFPTNSLILQGLIEFLQDSYTVYCVDLPGFMKTKRPLSIISLQNYAKYVEEEVRNLYLDSFFIVGISFGFGVISNMELSEECKGILAISPFLGTVSLNKKKEWMGLAKILWLVEILHLSNLIWKSSVFCKIFRDRFFKDKSIDISNVILDQVDGRTFMSTLRLILTTPAVTQFHPTIPHVLFLNMHDDTIRNVYILDEFRKNIPKLLHFDVNLPHFPTDISKEFFQQSIPSTITRQTISFLS